MEICSVLLIIREMEIKTIVRYHFTGQNGHHQKKKKKTTTNYKYWRGCGEKGTLLNC